MIAVDTSALMAILLGEPESDSLISALDADTEVLISAAIVAEALSVAGRRNVADEMVRIIEDLGLTIVPVTAAVARRMAEAYGVWGKGVHPAGLNFGDCFSYAIARDHACPPALRRRGFRQDRSAKSATGGIKPADCALSARSRRRSCICRLNA